MCPLTFRIQLHVDDVAHDGGVMKVLDSLPGTLDSGKDHFGDAQVLLVLGVVENLHLFHFTVFLAHVSQKVFTDVIVQLGKGDLLGRHWPHVKFINLETRTRWGAIKIIVIVSERGGRHKDGTGGRGLKHPANFRERKLPPRLWDESLSRAEPLLLQAFIETGSFLGYKYVF